MTPYCNIARPYTRLFCCRHYGGKVGKSSGAGSSPKSGGTSGGTGGCCGPPATPAVSLYDARKYGHVLPSNDVMTPFDPLCPIPTGVFRNTCGEILGPFAGKCAFYRNPEYYSFHHMSYFDLQLCLCCCRMPPPKTGRKP
ncbi:uncharacterized protein [Choristoneura fumiferana]|uniref:uncharacterized protein n=1 Tax=Choristoneura fumiferana TaxID=7141 RepID=UPI003D155DD7